MSSTAALNRRDEVAPNDGHHPSPPFVRPSSRRTLSFSSSPSLSSTSSSLGSLSFRDDSPLFSPSTPLRPSGIPFSWEKLPGIPKIQLSKKNDTSLNLLPLPPAGNPTPTKKLIGTHEIWSSSSSPPPRRKNAGDTFRRDPFFAALVECSKEDDDEDNGDDDQDQTDGDSCKGSKVFRTLSDRFTFIATHASCRRNCPVSESIIFIPRSRNHDIFRGRSS
ncbi:hypothetical protein U1Q18_036967 [Sarracenia purpurea var. burkii]